MDTIGFIGAGNMAFALATSFFQKNSSLKFVLYDPDSSRCNLFKENFAQNAVIATNSDEVATQANLLILAVKPQMISTVASSFSNGIKSLKAKNGLLLSILAGISISKLETFFPDVAIARLMPNAPCLIGEMAGGLVFNKLVTKEKGTELVTLLSAAGEVVCVDETVMDGVTALSGSGPAFIALLIEAFIEAGVKQGLSKEASRFLTLATFSGSANLLKKRALSPKELVELVSSPQGTTVAGREKLEASPYKDIIAQTIEAATKRSKELGGR